MFNGTRKHGPEEFDNQMEMNRGSNNAYLTEDTAAIPTRSPAPRSNS